MSRGHAAGIAPRRRDAGLSADAGRAELRKPFWRA